MEIFVVIFFTCCYDCGCWNCWFGYFLCKYCPVIGIFIEIWQSIFWDTISDTNVNSCWRKNSMYFIKHWFRIWTWIITTKGSIKASLVNYSIETTIFKLKLSSVHLLELKIWYFFLIIFLHLFNYGKWNINICDVLESIFKHFFAHLRVATTKIKNLKWGLNVLCNYILNSTVSLIPVEWLLVFLISIFPVFLLSVLSHFSNN